jgi:single-strand DNA-binding protein
MYNRVIMVGNLTKDPELRYTPQGTPVANFRLAVSTRYRSGEEMKEDSLFIDVVVWGKQGESVSQYLSKGRPVLVEGRLQERRWEYEGQQKSKMEIVAQTVRFLGGRRDEGQGPRQGTPGQTPPDEITDIEPF